MAKNILLAIGAIVLVLIVGVVFLSPKPTVQPTQEEPRARSAAETVPEPASPKTEIAVEGQNASVMIEPSVDNVISGVVTITVTKAPNGTKLAFFTIQGQGIEATGPNLGSDSDGSDGWSRLVDTTEYENGLYEIGGLAMPGPDDNPLGVASAQVKIQN